MEYRVRMRTKSGSKVIGNANTLEEAYEIINKAGAGTNKHFAIDEIHYKVYSVLTARAARERIEKGDAND